MTHFPKQTRSQSIHILCLAALLSLPLVLASRPAEAQSTTCYEVADPDGWVNVRDRATGNVVAQIDNGSRFWSDSRTRDNMVILDVPHDNMVISPSRLKPIASGQGCDSYTVSDRDGYVNLRQSPNGKVIGRVDAGSIAIVVGRADQWWRVLMSDGRTGFVHSSRLR
jgi:Bacterial SH3 domain